MRHCVALQVRLYCDLKAVAAEEIGLPAGTNVHIARPLLKHTFCVSRKIYPLWQSKLWASTVLSAEKRAFMPAAGGAAEAACFGTSLIRLPRPPDGMGGGGPGPPRFAAEGAAAGAGLAASEA